MNLLGHHGHRIVAAFMLLLAAIVAANITPPWAAVIVMTPGILITAVAQYRHDSRLCERCLATMPLTSPELAVRRRRVLRAVHLMNKPVRLTNNVSVPVAPLYLLGTPTALMAIIKVVGGKPGLMGAALALSFFIPAALMIPATAMHRRLQPWCPYCRWGRGGDGPPETTPGPGPHSRRPHPAHF